MNRQPIGKDRAKPPAASRVRPRRGFSLLEVVLALAILLGSIAVLGELMRQGLRSAAASKELATASLLAESAMSELVSGARPIEPLEGQPIDGQPGWQLSIEELSTAQRGLVEVRVRVAREGSAANTGCLLVRLIRRSSAPADAANAAPGQSRHDRTTVPIEAAEGGP